MSVTRELSFDGVGTTQEPPKCRFCDGAGYYRDCFKDATLCCEPCDGNGYERGENASLLASVPDEDWSAFYREGINEPGVVRGSRYQQVSEDVAEVVG